MRSPFTDRRRLVGDAYAGPSKLSARQDLYRFRREGPDFHDRLVTYIAEVLQPLLRPRYAALAALSLLSDFDSSIKQEAAGLYSPDEA